MVLLERLRLLAQGHNHDDPTSRFLDACTHLRSGGQLRYFQRPNPEDLRDKAAYCVLIRLREAACAPVPQGSMSSSLEPRKPPHSNPHQTCTDAQPWYCDLVEGLCEDKSKPANLRLTIYRLCCHNQECCAGFIRK